MESAASPTFLVAIVGETASGKSALAVELAEQFGGEIICADSRTVYKGMDIGTAKPSDVDRDRVPHHLLDILEPNQTCTAQEFQQRAFSCITEIAARGKIPILVGGSGLYVDSVLYDFSFRPPGDEKLRTELQNLSVDELQARLNSAGISLPQNKRNPRHLIRALETGGRAAGHRQLRANTLVIGVRIPREELLVRIAARTDAMLAEGLIDETYKLKERYGTEAPGLQAPGYKEVIEYLSGKLSLEEVREAIIRATAQLAKRQRTWFRRNKSIHWISKREGAVALITTFLNK